MRGFWINPILILLVGGAGLAACHGMGMNPHPRELIAAAITALVASEAGLAPLILVRHGDHMAVSQASLAGTVLHLFVAIAIAAVVVLALHRLATDPYLYWLLAFYFPTLIVLSACFVRAVKAAAVVQSRPSA